MQTKFKKWLLNPEIIENLNIFEKAKMNLTIDFAFYYLQISLLFVIISLFTKDVITSAMTGIFFTGNLSAVISIRKSQSHELTAKALTFSMVLGIMLVSFVNFAIVDIAHIMLFILAVLFAYFTLGRKWTMFLIAFMSLYLFAITYLKTTIYFDQFIIFFNPDFDPKILTLVSPLVTLIIVFIIIVMLDINRDNQLKMLQMATNSNRLKEGILSVVAHDLTSPIANIVVINDFLKTNITEPQNDDGESVVYTEMIDRMCQQSLHIINDLVDVAEIESENLVMEKKKINLIPFIGAIIHSQQIKASQKEIHLQVIPTEGEIFALINAEKFTRVIDNMVTNAIKFTPLKGEVKVAISATKTHARITISDNGIGIPVHLKELIFDKFTIAGRRGTSGEKSLGLGMSISKKIVELHLGKIWFDSTENKGTTFNIELPLAI